MSYFPIHYNIFDPTCFLKSFLNVLKFNCFLKNGIVKGTVSLKVGQLETMITVNSFAILLLHGLVFAFGNVKFKIMLFVN